MTAHWIEVKEGQWKMQAEVIGFKPYQVTMVERTSEGMLWDCLTAWGSWTKREQRCVNSFKCLASTQHVSFTRQRWITPVTTTWPVRQSRMSMFIRALNGIATNSNYHD